MIERRNFFKSILISPIMFHVKQDIEKIQIKRYIDGLKKKGFKMYSNGTMWNKNDLWTTNYLSPPYRQVATY